MTKRPRGDGRPMTHSGTFSRPWSRGLDHLPEGETWTVRFDREGKLEFLRRDAGGAWISEGHSPAAEWVRRNSFVLGSKDHRSRSENVNRKSFGAIGAAENFRDACPPRPASTRYWCWTGSGRKQTLQRPQMGGKRKFGSAGRRRNPQLLVRDRGRASRIAKSSDGIDPSRHYGNEGRPDPAALGGRASALLHRGRSGDARPLRCGYGKVAFVAPGRQMSCGKRLMA